MLIFGAGGHAKVVIDAIFGSEPSWTATLRIIDEDPALAGMRVLGIPVERPADVVRSGTKYHIAIGNNVARERLAFICQAAGMAFTVIAHATSTISSAAVVHEGSFVACGAIIGPDARVATGCIINHGAVVDHDCRVGPFSHIAPNATLAGNVKVGARVLIGAGANILPGVSIGDDCIIGAGAVVLRDLPPMSKVVGVPAI